LVLRYADNEGEGAKQSLKGVSVARLAGEKRMLEKRKIWGRLRKTRDSVVTKNKEKLRKEYWHLTEERTFDCGKRDAGHNPKCRAEWARTLRWKKKKMMRAVPKFLILT